MKHRWAITAPKFNLLGGYLVLCLGVAGCSKSPTETATDAAKAVGEVAGASIVPRDASRQAERLAATIDDRPECGVYLEQIRQAGLGSPASGKTQMAFQKARQAAREAGCLKTP